MTESQFIERNKADWVLLEQLLHASERDADKLNNLFTKVSSDLAYARTFFPNRSVRLYLNGLTKQVFDSMRAEKKRSGFKQMIYFFKEILPYEIYLSRKALLISLFVFTAAMMIGVFSCTQDPDFPRLILSDGYVDMTEENIAKGDPMAVYKDEDRAGMFLGISTNNIRVSFLAFVLGLLGSIGTIFVLISNGIMVGAFQYFFYQKGLFMVSFLTIWIHGTIEISSIIIAGGAGIVLGNGLVFPGTYKRSTSLRISARRALRIILGLIPMFILAALLESYVTRLTEMPNFLKATIIIASAVLILSYFVFYPWYKFKNNEYGHIENQITPQSEENYLTTRFKSRTFGEIAALGFMKYRQYIGVVFTSLCLPVVLVYLVPLWYEISTNFLDKYSMELGFKISEHAEVSWLAFVLMSIVFSIGFTRLIYALMKEDEGLEERLPSFFKRHFIFIFTCIFLYALPVFLLGTEMFVLFVLLFPLHIIYVLVIERIDNRQFELSQLPKLFFKAWKLWPQYFVYNLIGIIVFSLLSLTFSSSLGGIIVDFISWHSIFEYDSANRIFILSLLEFFCIALVIPLNFFLCYYQHASLECKETAKDLNIALANFGTKSKRFE